MAGQHKTAGRERPLLDSEQRSSGERSEPERSCEEPNNGRRAEGGAVVSNESLERPRRRTFTAEYKRKILAAADAAAGQVGAIGALLRREGLFSSHLTKWRAERDSGALAGLEPRRRGPAPRQVAAQTKRLAQLERENARLRHQLKQAEIIIEFQKKLHDVLGIPLSSPPESNEI